MLWVAQESIACYKAEAPSSPARLVVSVVVTKAKYINIGEFFDLPTSKKDKQLKKESFVILRKKKKKGRSLTDDGAAVKLLPMGVPNWDACEVV